MSDSILTSNGELCHYGRKGMKWGQSIFGDKPYKSPATRDFEKRSDKYEKRSTKYSGKASAAKDPIKRIKYANKAKLYKAKSNEEKRYAKRASNLDAKVQKIARNMDKGERFSHFLLAGAYGARNYATARAAGLSEGRAMVDTLINNEVWANSLRSEEITRRYAKKKDLLI